MTISSLNLNVFLAIQVVTT